MNNQPRIEEVLNSGNIIIYARKGFLSNLWRFITRQHASGCGLYLEIDGTPVVVTSLRSRISYIYFDNWKEKDRSWIFAYSVDMPRPYMRKMIHQTGKKKHPAVMIAELMEFDNPDRYGTNEIYKYLN